MTEAIGNGPGSARRPDRDATPRWREMDDAARADAYSPSKALPDGDLTPFLQAYIDRSAAAHQACGPVQAVRYGPLASNTIDLVVPDDEGPAPLLVYIHGGYWQELSKRESFLPAPDCLARGIGFAAVDYTLAPAATIDAIGAECLAAVSTLFDEARSLGIDPDRIVLSGSSAGAHLVAMTCLALPADKRPRGVVLLSGIYELEPLIGTYVNDALGMDVTTARRNSPALADLSGFPPALIAWGAVETDEFKRQSRTFATLLPAAETLEVLLRNHFDILFDLADDSALGGRTVALAKE